MNAIYDITVNEEPLSLHNYDIEPTGSFENLCIQQMLVNFLHSALPLLDSASPPALLATIHNRLDYLQKFAFAGIREVAPQLFQCDPDTLIERAVAVASAAPSHAKHVPPEPCPSPERPSLPPVTVPDSEPDLSHLLETELRRPGDPTDDDLDDRDAAMHFTMQLLGGDIPDMSLEENERIRKKFAPPVFYPEPLYPSDSEPLPNAEAVPGTSRNEAERAETEAERGETQPEHSRSTREPAETDAEIDPTLIPVSRDPDYFVLVPASFWCFFPYADPGFSRSGLQPTERHLTQKPTHPLGTPGQRPLLSKSRRIHLRFSRRRRLGHPNHKRLRLPLPSPPQKKRGQSHSQSNPTRRCRNQYRPRRQKRPHPGHRSSHRSQTL